MEKQLITQNSSAPVVMPMSIKDLLSRQSAVVEAVSKAMKEGLHYGSVPGIEKPFLQKPGAELLCLMFGLSATFKVEERQLPSDHREFVITCSLTRGDHVIAEGVGSCSTMEAKYRYRKGKGEAIGAVPREYWDLRKTDPKAAQRMIGFGNGTEKTPDGWVITKAAARVENPDIADQYNTVLKMAKKRAYVDACITACAASEFFTQDEDAVTGDAHIIESVVVADAIPQQQAAPQHPPHYKSMAESSAEMQGKFIYKFPKGMEQHDRESLVKVLKDRKYRWDKANYQWYGSVLVPECAAYLASPQPKPEQVASVDNGYEPSPEYYEQMAAGYEEDPLPW